MSKIFMSPTGNDRGDGSVKNPVKTFDTAIRLLGEANISGFDGGAELVLAGGAYVLDKPLVFTKAQSYGLTVSPAEGERAVITSAKPLEMSETTENGARVWVTHLPEVLQGREYRTLLVNGERAERPRLPREGFYDIKYVENIDFEKAKTDPSYENQLFRGTDRFFVNKEEWSGLSRVRDIELVIPHYWTDEHATVESYDAGSGLVIMNEMSRFSLADDFVARYSRYAMENVYDAMEAGNWFIKKESGTLLYMPRDGETLENTRLSLPVLKTGIVFDGAEHITLSNLEISGFDWELPNQFSQAVWDATGKRLAGYPQSAAAAPAAICFEHSRFCRITNCLMKNIGGYGVGVAAGCRNITVSDSEITLGGAGGVRVDGGDASSPEADRTSGIVVKNCRIHDLCKTYMAGCGILSMHASYCRYENNEIYNVIYTGISVGWVWGYAPSVSHHNIISGNHIYNIGSGLLSDMGGIYTLGEQPGTELTHNRIHDIRGRNYGGWGIYPDEGSSYMLIEHNICYNTSSQGFHQHYGRENIVRNNIFAFSDAGTAAFTRPEKHNSASFYNNIFLSDGKPFFVCRSNGMDIMNFISDSNVFFDYANPGGFTSGDGDNDGVTEFAMNKLWSFEEWQATGRDINSKIADPGFKDPKNGDFSLR